MTVILGFAINLNYQHYRREHRYSYRIVAILIIIDRGLPRYRARGCGLLMSMVLVI